MTLTGGGEEGSPATAGSPPRRPRNYLARGDHRRLFLVFMPPAVLALLTANILLRRDSPRIRPPEPQLDTRLEAITGPPPREGAVVIEPAEEPLEVTDASQLGASVTSLARVRDATRFRTDDHDAWFEMWLTLQGHDGRRPPPVQDVGFTELFTQPKSFRGRSVRMAGTLRRVEKVESPANDYGVREHWEGWLEPADGPASPVAVHLLRLPDGMAAGREMAEPVAVEGLFLKNVAYIAGDGLRVAPLILAVEPVRRRPPQPSARPDAWQLSLTAAGVVTMLTLVSMIAVGFAVVGRVRRHRVATAADLDANLADLTTSSVEEGLREIAAGESRNEPARDPNPDGA